MMPRILRKWLLAPLAVVSVLTFAFAAATAAAATYSGTDSAGGTFKLQVSSKGITAVTWNGIWNCSHNGGPIAPESTHFFRSFKSHPIPVKKQGKVYAARHFSLSGGSATMSLSGHLTSQKFHGLFSLGFLSSTDGCGTDTLTVNAKRK
jgi:hypothetical protein